MSRAFVKEDAGSWGDPSKRYSLPAREDPGFDKAAAETRPPLPRSSFLSRRRLVRRGQLGAAYLQQSPGRC